MFHTKLSNTSLTLRLIVCLLAFVSIITIRIPFLDKVLSGEEGSHAALIVKQFEGSEIILGNPGPSYVNSCLLVVGHINGSDILTHPSRNIMPYCIINKFIQPLALPVFKKIDSFETKTVYARSIFLLIASIGFISCLMVCFLVSLRLSGISILIPYLIIFYASSSPLLVGASIQPQLDGTIGVALISLSFLFMYIASQKFFKGNICYTLLFFSGLLLAICKNEWPLAFIASLIGFLILYFLARKINVSNKKFTNTFLPIEKVQNSELSTLLIGLLIGIGLSVAISPSDYLSGFSLMSNIEKGNHSSLALVKNYQDALFPLGGLFISGILLTIVNLYRPLSATPLLPLIYFIFAANIALGFISSGWIGDGFPRYYAPPILLMALYLIFLLPQTTNKLGVLFVISAIIILVILSYNNLKSLEIYRKNSISITVPGDTNWIKSDLDKAAKAYLLDPNTVSISHSSVYYYFPAVNFISRDLGDENIAISLVRKYGTEKSRLVQ
jgi:hypothetical protein